MPFPHDAKAISDLIEAGLAGDEQVRHRISNYLGLHELIAAGAMADVFDVSIIDLVSGGRFISVEENYRRWIVAKRKELERPALYFQLERLTTELRRLRGVGMPGI